MTELIASAKEWTAGYGDPFKPGALGGPLVSERQRDKVADYVNSAIQEGGKIVYGGEKVPRKGWFFMPTSTSFRLLNLCFGVHLMGGYE